MISFINSFNNKKLPTVSDALKDEDGNSFPIINEASRF